MQFPQTLLQSVLAWYGLGPKSTHSKRRPAAIEIGHADRVRRWA